MVVVSCRVANRVKDPIRGILGDPELFFQFIQVKSRYEAVAESKWDTRSRQLVNAVEVDKLGFFATRGAGGTYWLAQSGAIPAVVQQARLLQAASTLQFARRSTLQMFEKST
ncbi:hypothetical protein E4U09_001654 [Claviceps aff. purpurea]|uniref:Uncharacterized protein n=1 Tax=Claviceps aff. purpurea TaxID=1967640 RepID=A0A9P7TZ92_9HYPO|nr:hypothetical protein E4U09_001654 [Claviceps aff. purpurea]